jgi:hypothetical protein
MDGPAVLILASSQRGVFAHRRCPVAQHHGLKGGVSSFGAHGFAYQLRERLGENVLQRGARYFTANFGLARVLDRYGERRRRVGSMRLREGFGQRRQTVTPSDASQRFVQQESGWRKRHIDGKCWAQRRVETLIYRKR